MKTIKKVIYKGTCSGRYTEEGSYTKGKEYRVIETDTSDNTILLNDDNDTCLWADTEDFYEVDSVESLKEKKERLEKELRETEENLEKKEEEERRVKVGDIAVVTSGVYDTHNIGDIIKVVKVEDKRLQSEELHRKYPTFNGFLNLGDVRKATEDEIEKYKRKNSLPKIKGYSGEIKGDEIHYGCTSFPISYVKDLERMGIKAFSIDTATEKYVVVDRDQFSQILKAIDANR